MKQSAAHFKEQWEEIINENIESTISIEHVNAFRNIIIGTRGLVGDGNHRLLLVQKLFNDHNYIIPTKVIFPTSSSDLLFQVMGMFVNVFILHCYFLLSLFISLFLSESNWIHRSELGTATHRNVHYANMYCQQFQHRLFHADQRAV